MDLRVSENQIKNEVSPTMNTVAVDWKYNGSSKCFPNQIAVNTMLAQMMRHERNIRRVMRVVIPDKTVFSG